MDDITTISMVVSAALSLVSLYLGGRYRQAKRVLNNLVDMIEDDKITEAELREFLKSIKDLIHYV